MDHTLSKGKRILIIAGESSADRYAAQLVNKILQLRAGDPISFFGTGGDRMREAGVQMLAHIRDLAHIGPREALSQFRKYYFIYRSILAEVGRDRPDLAVLLDFPDFNLRLAKKTRRS